ncbi:serine/threonine protein kinase [Coraliomargarita akajimensis DSM 45221]|uniref:Serine/threonine protein kinase n=2 Tax=Coraliomargarita TaxID=442430 RepID=D5EHN9_CORAD|nr:serine/threonine protein kinase [Coraliomargarita akajimensis DSM 45221]
MIMDISDMGFTDELSSLQPGMNLGNLHVVSFLGKGAIGEVYLTQHDILGKQFALKVIPKGFSPEEAAEAFKDAARIQTKLEHPNIVKIDDLGEEDMFYWMRMEYIEGEVTPDNVTIRSVDDLMRHQKGALTEEEVAYYLYYLLLGLDHAHSQGIIHTALKPSNVMIGEEGVKIAELGVTDLIGHAWDDFHLLRLNPLLEPTPFDPLPGFSRQLPTLLNVFEYYSPEQRAGKKPTIQSNLYTVGLIAYRMLTGRHCLSFDLPTNAVNGINPRWDEWMTRALAYDLEDRFETASEMLQDMPGLEGSEEAADDSQASA